jgi:hypothetical protein
VSIRTKADRLLIRAAMGNWPITDEQRADAIRRLTAIIANDAASPRDVTSAVRALAAIDRQQQLLQMPQRGVGALPAPQAQGGEDDPVVVERKRQLVAQRLRELGLTVIDATGSVVGAAEPAG